MRTYPFQLYSSTSLTALSSSFSSTGHKIDYTIGYSVQAVYGEGARGVMTLQASNDNLNYTTIAGSSAQVMGSGNFLWNVMSANYDYMRFNFASSAASSGILTVNFYSKGF